MGRHRHPRLSHPRNRRSCLQSLRLLMLSLMLGQPQMSWQTLPQRAAPRLLPPSIIIGLYTKIKNKLIHTKCTYIHRLYARQIIYRFPWKSYLKRVQNDKDNLRKIFSKNINLNVDYVIIDWRSYWINYWKLGMVNFGLGPRLISVHFKQLKFCTVFAPYSANMNVFFERWWSIA
jgi:hypothetical protein